MKSLRIYKKTKYGTVGYIENETDKMFHCIGFVCSYVPAELVADAAPEEIGVFESGERRRQEQSEIRQKKETELLSLCELKHSDFVRFRSVYREGNVLTVETRENGVSARSVEAIRNKYYKNSKADEGDSTYEYYEFEIPPEKG